MLLRALVPLAPVTHEVPFASMALGGTIAWVTVAVFAVLFIRARRAHLAYLRRTAAWRAGSLTVLE